MATGHVTTPQIYVMHWVKMWDHFSSRWDVTQIQMLWWGSHKIFKSMMTSPNGKNFPVTGPLYGEFTGKRVYSPHKGKWRGALMFYLICAWINGWVNNREAGDLRRHRSHYDVIVMICVFHISHKNIAINSSVLKIMTIRHGRDLWNLARSHKQLYLLCPPDSWNWSAPVPWEPWNLKK